MPCFSSLNQIHLRIFNIMSLFANCEVLRNYFFNLITLPPRFSELELCVRIRCKCVELFHKHCTKKIAQLEVVEFIARYHFWSKGKAAASKKRVVWYVRVSVCVCEARICIRLTRVMKLFIFPTRELVRT